VPVEVAIVGQPGSGKTTLFRALTGDRSSDGVGMVDVPDPRLERLAAAVGPRRVVPAQVRVVDAPPGSRARRIAAAREADVVIEVLRGFGIDRDPASELEGIELDLALADLATVERRLETVGREVRAGRKERAAELSVLERVREHLDAGGTLATLELDASSAGFLEPLFPVSAKPRVVVVNVGDDLLPDGGEPVRRVRELTAGRGWPVLAVDAQLELELGRLDPADARELRATYHAPEASLDATARAVWEAGGLITFFTAGEPEVRAWPCRRDTPAPVAAGVIHSDFEKGFIRAEVTSVDELVAAGSMEALRAAGRLRVEGRDYRLRDGDVVYFRVGR
jgi:ribosome-binding ATPase YchF (GTP1/OBG family)